MRTKSFSNNEDANKSLKVINTIKTETKLRLTNEFTMKSEVTKDSIDPIKIDPAVDASAHIPMYEVWIKCTQPNVLPVFIIHATSCFAQFIYISSIGFAATNKFKMSAAVYGMLVSYFGATYTLSLVST